MNIKVRGIFEILNKGHGRKSNKIRRSAEEKKIVNPYHSDYQVVILTCLVTIFAAPPDHLPLVKLRI